MVANDEIEMSRYQVEEHAYSGQKDSKSCGVFVAMVRYR